MQGLFKEIKSKVRSLVVFFSSDFKANDAYFYIHTKAEIIFPIIMTATITVSYLGSPVCSPSVTPQGTIDLDRQPRRASFIRVPTPRTSIVRYGLL
jgi:hypothetical protein